MSQAQMGVIKPQVLRYEYHSLKTKLALLINM